MINTTLHLAFFIKHTGTYENGKQTRCGKMKNNMEKILLLVLLSWYTHLVIDKNGGFYYDNEKRPNDQPAYFLTDCFLVCASWICGCQTSKKSKSKHTLL